jgi:hypothetical protein
VDGGGLFREKDAKDISYKLFTLMNTQVHVSIYTYMVYAYHLTFTCVVIQSKIKIDFSKCQLFDVCGIHSLTVST